MSGALAMILAGGEGTRLMPLTQSRTKPAVPFGGSYRLVDFVLNNFVNSGIIKIFLITQYKSQSLMTHIKNGWQVSGINGAFIDILPAQMRVSREWYQGTSDAIFQNLSYIDGQFPDNVCIFGSDNIYKMNVREMLTYHKMKNADLTVSAVKMKAEECAKKFGIIEVDKDNKMIGFEEKPENPKEIPSEPGYCLVSMGNYVFKYEVLRRELIADSQKDDTQHDFGKDIIPKLYKEGKTYVYDFSKIHIEGEPNSCYWRDVGTIDIYWQAHMDLLGNYPKFNLQNPQWALHTYYPPLPPANFTDTDNNESHVSMSMISAGCKIEGATINKSVLGFRCTACDGASVDGCVLIGDNYISKNAKLKNVILDRNVQIGPNFVLGYNKKQDHDLIKSLKNSMITFSKNGIIVLPKGIKLGFD